MGFAALNAPYAAPLRCRTLSLYALIGAGEPVPNEQHFQRRTAPMAGLTTCRPASSLRDSA